MISARMLGLEVTRVSAGEELVRCPFHSDSNASAWFNPHKGLFWCAVCNLGLSAKQLITKMGTDIDLDQVVSDAEGEIPDLDLIQENHILPMGNPHQWSSYYEGRGVSEEVVGMYQLEVNIVNHSIVFPVSDIWGNRIGSVERFINSEATGTRYKKSGTMTPVWPLHFLNLFKKGDSFIVTEGAFSALRLCTWSKRQGGRGIAFTLFGAKANQEIIDVLRPFNPVFLYDKDEAGINACRKMRKLAPEWDSVVLAKAPDDMSSEEINELMVKVTGRLRK